MSGRSGGTRMTLHRELYFPTCIFFADFEDSDAFNARLGLELYEWRAEDRDGVVRSNLPETGTWHSQVDMAQRAQYRGLADRILQCTRAVFDDMGYDPRWRPEISNMWANIAPRYGQNRSHTHPGSLWSGVYYVQVPQGAGRIHFTDPRPQAMVLQPVYARAAEARPESWTEVHYEPLEGRVILFPSWLVHEVRPNMSEVEGGRADRISVSFNIEQRPAGDRYPGTEERTE